MCYGFWTKTGFCQLTGESLFEFVAIGSFSATKDYMEYHGIQGSPVKAKMGAFKYL